VKTWLGTSSFEMAIERMIDIYSAGNRVVVSFSGGKDSTVAMEVCLLAAIETDRTPVEVVMRDEEIMFPGTFEYCERVAQRDEIDFHWVYACQPVINVFDRARPYWWVFDPLLEPSEWVREPPPFAYQIEDQFIQAITSSKLFPPPAGGELFCVTGLRTDESPNRIRGVHSAGGHLTKLTRWGFRRCNPIYDMSDGGVWKAIGDNGWDWNRAYDVMTRFGVARRLQRIAPPTQRAAQLEVLTIAAKSYPRWFDRVTERLPGIRAAVQFGRVVLEPRRNIGEPWSATFQRECIDTAPPWIAARNTAAMEEILAKHASHSSQPFPEAQQCVRCGVTGSWMRLAKDLYTGDPFSFTTALPPVEPEFFREGAGKWGGGSPSW
jgi:predicted phosphoadenosine phosphosulfate sulfurtransferase